MVELRTLSALLVLASFGACGDDDALLGTDPYRPYEEENVTVLGGTPEQRVASGALPDGADCIQVSPDVCTPVDRQGKYCKEGTGPTDIIVVDGVVVEVVCYEDTDSTPNKPSVIVDMNSDGSLDIPQTDNGAVITFDPSTDGMAFVGDVTIDGNNVTLYGNGPDNSIIDGNLTISGNNARVRGVRVTGNVTITLNTGAFVLSVVEGNLLVESNNSLVAENDVYGNFTVTGNNSILVGNDVQGNWELSGKDALCDANHAFTDESDDMMIQDTERKTEELPCN